MEGSESDRLVIEILFVISGRSVEEEAEVLEVVVDLLLDGHAQHMEGREEVEEDFALRSLVVCR